MKYCTSCKAKYDDSVSFCSIDGEVLEADPASIVDTVLDGQYQMEALLGKGGMGAVYRARHILLGDRVAIKVLPPEVRTNAEWLRRFRREGQAARRFRHPNSVTVYDLRTAADGTIYMVMEYVEGHTLDHELKTRGRFTPAEALEILTPIMSVLETAHSMGVVHRDLKPEIDGRADIYSLGLVFYEMISGRRCFVANTLHELRREHVVTMPKPLYQVVANVPRGFSGAIERATAKDRGDRPATAAEFANELRAGLTTAVDPLADPSELVETVALKKELDTKSDVNAPTIITIDSPQTSPPNPSPPPTSAPTVVEKRKPDPPPVDPAMSGATVAESAEMASIATAVPVSRPAAPVKPADPVSPPVSAPAKKSSIGLIIGALVLVGLVAAAGIAGYFIWNRSKTVPSVTTNGTTTPVAPAAREITRYWLELEPAREGAHPSQVAALVPIASGQSFKFHFVFSESGYVYIFGPGEKNQPTAFLTSKPLPDSGVTSNQATGGGDFSFPRGAGNNVTLDKNPGTDVFTIIFAKSALSSPSFLNEAVTGEPLSSAQQAELKTFVSKYTQKSPVTELDESNPRAPQVRVKVQSDQTNNPIVFEIRIQHN